MSFVSLHNHTHYSILQALPSPKELLSRAKELNQSAVAITDTGTFAGVWDAYKASKEVGIKLIVGAEFYFLPDPSKKDEKLKYIILLAKNAEGYRNLLTLNRSGFDTPILTGRKVLSVIDWDRLAKYSSGVLCLTGGGNGILGQHLNTKNFEAAETDALKLIDIFGKKNLGIEVQPNTLNRQATNFSHSINQIFTNYHLIKLAEKLDLKVVPTCATRYLKKEDHETHDVMLAIGAMQPVYSNARMKFNVSDFYLKSYEEVKLFFERNYGEDFAAKICKNSVYFADQCENPEWVSPKYSNPRGKELPVFDVKSSGQYDDFKKWISNQNERIQAGAEDSAYLRFKCYQAYDKKIKFSLSTIKQKEYIERIENELMVLDKQGYSSYMLIVADYVEWARKNQILVGPGRGSVGGSILAYLLNVHMADPIKYGLIFERFHNIDKTSMPDADLDFSTGGRDRVIQYITDKYGSEKVSFISNFNQLKPKMYVRDVARSCQFGNDRKKAIEIGNNAADTISKQAKDLLNFKDLCKYSSPLFNEYINKYPEYSKYSTILGKIRNTSVHAGAQIISRRPLVGLVPLRVDKDGHQLIEYEKNNAEDNGLLKVDILGLSTLDLIDATINIINRDKEIIKLEDIKFEDYDKKTYDLISSGDTYGVFQFGTSAGTIDLCKKIKPRSIDDLAIITTLARPAAAPIREDFIRTREGKRDFRLLHPSLKNALEPTFGFFLYDETILQLAQDVAGWKMNEADRLRKMIKEKGKYPEKDKKLREDFISGSIKNGIEPQMATRIWDEHLSSLKSYTFNKSHAVLYSFISYITAYLKAHYPIEFLLANLIAETGSSAPDAEANIDRAKFELRARKVKIAPPNINKSQRGYELIDKHILLTGLNALKFVGADAIVGILEKRPFESFDDFMLKVETKKVRSSAIQALAAAGCLDIFNIPRRSIYLYCSDYRKKLQVWLKRHNPTTDTFVFPWPNENEWSKSELYALEKHYLGEAFICPKKEAFGKFFIDKHDLLVSVRSSKNRTHFPSVKAEIKTVFELKVKKEGSRLIGQEMAKVMIEDSDGTQLSLTIFPEKWKEIKDRIKAHRGTKGKIAFEPGFAIHFSGTSNLYENEMGVILDNLYELLPPPSLPRDLKSKKMSIKDADSTESNDLVEELENQLFTEGFVDLGEDPFSVDI